MNKLRIAGLAAGLWGLTGCGLFEVAGGTGVGNPPQADVALSLKANGGGAAAKHAAGVTPNPDSSISALDSLGHLVRITSVDILIGKVEFVLPKSVPCSAVRGLYCKDTSAWIDGPYDVDLMTGSFSPAINFIKLPEGVYKELKLGLGVPSGTKVYGKSDSLPQDMIVRGRLGDSTAGRDFELSLSIQDGLEFGDSTGIPIHAGSLNKVNLSLSADQWFRGMDMAGCLDSVWTAAHPNAPDSAGTVQLRGDAFCNGLGVVFKKNVEASGDFENKEEPE